jgi:putative nucleotidyltransferase-like protein
LVCAFAVCAGEHAQASAATLMRAIVMLFQQHLTLLSFLLKEDYGAFARQLRGRGVRLEFFAQFISRHQLQLFSFARLNSSPVRQCMPSQWLGSLRGTYLSRWAAQERLVRELVELSRLLSSKGHNFIVLKGPYVATRFLGSIDRRQFYDLDILIRREDLHTVERLLRDCGYKRKSTVLFNRTLTTHFTHALDFAKSNVALDLHWLLSANAAHSLDYNSIWRERQAFVLQNHTFYVLSEEYEVVFSLISIFKDLERGVARLKAFVDLYYILASVSQRINWEQFLANRKRERILKISLNVLSLFLNLFECADRFSEVATVVDRNRNLLKRISSEDIECLLSASPGALKNRLWATDLYDCSRTHVFLWWLVSLPFRLAVHEA